MSSELQDINHQNQYIINDTIHNKYTPIKWLYENQGDLRFGAENRLFIVLIDRMDFSQSWKLKREFRIIRPKITEYLDNFNRLDFSRNIIEFYFHQKSYRVLADAIFIVV